MKADGTPQKKALKLATATVFAALVCVATAVFTISIPATSGYFNLGETVIYVAALLFGALVGALAGGVGAAIADMILAPQFAIGTLVIKCSEGYIVGYLSRKLSSRHRNSIIANAVAIIAGGAVMIIGYFLYEQLFLNYTFSAALIEVPFNVVQMTVGLVVAIPIVRIIQRVFPRLKS
jgi:uncharacterized membrane protein